MSVSHVGFYFCCRYDLALRVEIWKWHTVNGSQAGTPILPKVETWKWQQWHASSLCRAYCRSQAGTTMLLIRNLINHLLSHLVGRQIICQPDKKKKSGHHYSIPVRVLIVLSFILIAMENVAILVSFLLSHLLCSLGCSGDCCSRFKIIENQDL